MMVMELEIAAMHLLQTLLVAIEEPHPANPSQISKMESDKKYNKTTPPLP